MVSRFLAAVRGMAALVFCAALLALPCSAMELAVRMDLPAAAGVSDGSFAAELAQLRDAGIDAVVLTPSALASEDGSPWLARPEAIAQIRDALAVVGQAGLRAYVTGLEVRSAERALDPAGQAAVLPEALRGALIELAASKALAGLVWETPPLPSLAGEASAPQAERSAREWSDGLAGLVRVCATLCRESDRRFIVETDTALPILAALRDAPEGVGLWRRQTVPRGPSLLPQRAVLEAAAWGDRAGVDLSWAAFQPSVAARIAAMATVAGCRTLVVGTDKDFLGHLGEEPQGWALVAGAFAWAEPQDTTPVTPSPDAIIAVDGFAELCRLVRPSDDDMVDEIPALLAALNQGGRSVRFALTPPADAPPLLPPAKPEAAAKVPVVFAPNSARLDDAFLAGLLAAADRGWTVALPSSVATLSPGGGARAKESRDSAVLALPFERSRPFQQAVKLLLLKEDLGSKPLGKNARFEVGAVPSQGIWRGTARPEARVLAEWPDAGAPAYISGRRGAGTLLVLNGLPGLTGPGVLGGVLDQLNVPSSRLPLAEELRLGGQRPTELRQGTLDRYGLIPEDPYRAAPEEQMIAPPEFVKGLLVAEETSAYDTYIAGEAGRFAQFGYRPDGTGRRRYTFGESTVLFGAWDYAATRGRVVVVSTPDTRFPEDLGPCRRELNGTDRPLVFQPAKGWREGPQPGLYHLAGPLTEHALVDAGGARVVRAERAGRDPNAGPNSGYLLIEVDRPATVKVQLDDALVAGQALHVGLGSYAATAGALAPQWWVTWDGQLLVDTLGRVPFVVWTEPTTEDPALAPASLSPGTRATATTCDGGEAVLLDCYADAEAWLGFTHWGPMGKQPRLVLRGVRGSMYGVGDEGADVPASITVLVNGREVYDAVVPWRTLHEDGTRDEWADLEIALPVDTLHRGANTVVVRNAGPNAVWLTSAEARFPAQEK